MRCGAVRCRRARPPVSAILRLCTTGTNRPDPPSAHHAVAVCKALADWSRSRAPRPLSQSECRTHIAFVFTHKQERFIRTTISCIQEPAKSQYARIRVHCGRYVHDRPVFVHIGRVRAGIRTIDRAYIVCPQTGHGAQTEATSMFHMDLIRKI